MPGTSLFRFVLPVITLVVTSCADQKEPAPGRWASESDEPVVTVASTTQIEMLNAVLPNDIIITRAYAVRSRDHAWAHYVAAKLRPADGSDWRDGRIGLWFMADGMDIPGTPSPVDALSDSLDGRPEIQALLKLTRERP